MAMNTLHQLPFEDSTFVEAVDRRFDHTIEADATHEAKALVQNLRDFQQAHPDFVKQNTSVFKQCQRLLVKASWVALPMLPELDVVNLIKNHLSYIATLPH